MASEESDDDDEDDDMADETDDCGESVDAFSPLSRRLERVDVDVDGEENMDETAVRTVLNEVDLRKNRR